MTARTMTSNEVQTSQAVGAAGAPEGGSAVDLPRLASIVVGIGFAVGLFYNVGFFLALDLQLFPLLTYKDHLETLVIFAPIAALPIFWCIGLRNRRRELASRAAIMLAVLTLAVWAEQLATRPSFETPVVIAAALAAFALVAYCAAVLLDRGLRINEAPGANRDEAYVALTVAAMGLLVFVTMLGAAQANLAMRSPAFDTQLILTGEGAQPPPARPARVVRVIDNGVLVVFGDAPGRIAFVRNETVRVLSDPAKR